MNSWLQFQQRMRRLSMSRERRGQLYTAWKAHFKDRLRPEERLVESDADVTAFLQTYGWVTLPESHAIKDHICTSAQTLQTMVGEHGMVLTGTSTCVALLKYIANQPVLGASTLVLMRSVLIKDTMQLIVPWQTRIHMRLSNSIDVEQAVRDWSKQKQYPHESIHVLVIPLHNKIDRKLHQTWHTHVVPFCQDVHWKHVSFRPLHIHAANTFNTLNAAVYVYSDPVASSTTAIPFSRDVKRQYETMQTILRAHAQGFALICYPEIVPSTPGFLPAVLATKRNAFGKSKNWLLFQWYDLNVAWKRCTRIRPYLKEIMQLLRAQLLSRNSAKPYSLELPFKIPNSEWAEIIAELGSYPELTSLDEDTPFYAPGHLRQSSGRAIRTLEPAKSFTVPPIWNVRDSETRARWLSILEAVHRRIKTPASISNSAASLVRSLSTNSKLLTMSTVARVYETAASITAIVDHSNGTTEVIFWQKGIALVTEEYHAYAAPVITNRLRASSYIPFLPPKEAPMLTSNEFISIFHHTCVPANTITWTSQLGDVLADALVHLHRQGLAHGALHLHDWLLFANGQLGLSVWGTCVPVDGWVPNSFDWVEKGHSQSVLLCQEIASFANNLLLDVSKAVCMDFMRSCANHCTIVSKILKGSPAVDTIRSWIQAILTKNTIQLVKNNRQTSYTLAFYRDMLLVQPQLRPAYPETICPLDDHIMTILDPALTKQWTITALNDTQRPRAWRCQEYVNTLLLKANVKDRYRLIKYVNQGTYGVIFLVEHEQTKQTRILKCIQHDTKQVSEYECFAQRVAANRLKTRPLRDYVLTIPNVYACARLAPKMFVILQDFVPVHRSKKTVKERWFIILRVLRHLHFNLHLTHTDLHHGNISMDENKVTVLDFGRSVVKDTIPEKEEWLWWILCYLDYHVALTLIVQVAKENVAVITSLQDEMTTFLAKHYAPKLTAVVNHQHPEWQTARIFMDPTTMYATTHVHDRTRTTYLRTITVGWNNDRVGLMKIASNPGLFFPTQS